MQIVMKFCSSYIYNYFETNSATTDMPKTNSFELFCWSCDKC